MARLARLARIIAIGLRFGLYEFFPGLLGNPFLSIFFFRKNEPRGQRLREALETLGPIFVKFGQVLSTRRDLIPEEFITELARLQDQAEPVPWEQIEEVLAQSLGRPADEVFAELLLDAEVPLFHPGVFHAHVLGFVGEVGEVDLGDVDEAGRDSILEEEGRIGGLENGGAGLGGAGLLDAAA